MYLIGISESHLYNQSIRQMVSILKEKLPVDLSGSE